MLDRSSILSYAHKQSKILGGHRFPSILKKLWSVSKDYTGRVSTKNILLNIGAGLVDSIFLMGELKKLGINIVYSDKHKEYVIEGIDFILPKYSTGIISLSENSINKIRLQLYRNQSLQEGLTITKIDLIIMILNLDKGFTFLSDNSVMTNVGIIVPIVKGYTDLYYFPNHKKEKYKTECRNSYSDTLDSSEKSIQASLVGLWNIFTNSTTSAISVDYEIGVLSGKKIISRKESRYDLVIREDSETSLIELKRGVIDIATLNYKISVMDMGEDVSTIHPHTSKTLVFIGNKVDAKTEKFLENIGASKLKVFTYNKYYSYLKSKINNLGLHQLDKEMAQFFLNTFKNLIYEQK